LRQPARQFALPREKPRVTSHGWCIARTKNKVYDESAASYFSRGALQSKECRITRVSPPEITGC
jgi:hypothetical protein